MECGRFISMVVETTAVLLFLKLGAVAVETSPDWVPCHTESFGVVVKPAQSTAVKAGVVAPGIKSIAPFPGWTLGGESCLRHKIVVADGAMSVTSPPGEPVVLCGKAFRFDNYRYRVTLGVSGRGEVEVGGFLPETGGRIFAGKMVDGEVPIAVTCDIDCRVPGETWRLEIRASGDLTLHDVRVFRAVEPGVLVAEGELSEISRPPELSKLDYPDCNVTAQLLCHAICAGAPAPQRMLLSIPAYRKYKVPTYAALKAGARYRLRICPFSELDDKSQAIQEVDDLQLFELEKYGLLSAVPLKEFSAADTGIGFSEMNAAYISVFDNRFGQHTSPAAAEAGRVFIASELGRMNRLIAEVEPRRAELNRRFSAAWKEEQARDVAGFNRPDGKVWRQMNGAFWALPPDFVLLRPAAIGTDNLNALRELNEMFAANGVQFMIQVIPHAFDLSARMLNPEFREVPDYASAAIVKQLLEAGIEADYCTDRLLKEAKDPLMFCYPLDDHPHDGCQDVLTDMMAEKLKRFRGGFQADMLVERFSAVWGPTIMGDRYRWPENCDTGSNAPGSVVNCKHILYDGVAVKFNKSSGVLVIGNSFMQTPAMPESYPSYLTMKLRYAPDVARSNGRGPLASLIVDIAARPERYLKGKQVVILPIGRYSLEQNFPFVNIRGLDENRKVLSGTKLCGTVRLPGPFPAPNLEKTPERAKVSPPVRDWEARCLRQGTALIPCAETRPAVFKLKLPEGVDPSRETICSIRACAFYGSSCRIKVNGLELAIPVTCDEPRYNVLNFCLPAGTADLTVAVAVESGKSKVSIDNVSFYQR